MKQGAVMRTLLPTLLVAFIRIAVVLFGIEARGQYDPTPVQPPVQVYSWGSADAVYQYCATNTQNVGIIISGKTNATRVDLAIATPGPYIFTDKSQVDMLFQELLLGAAQFALTNNGPAYDKSSPLQVVSYTWADDLERDLAYYYLQVTTNYSLVKSGNDYSLPDLSGIHLTPESSLEIRVPGISWGRLEVYYATNTASPFYVVDSRYDPPPSWPTRGVYVPYQEFYINTAYFTSGTTGPYRLKLSMTSSVNSNVFQVFDGSGYQIQTPLVLSNPALKNGSAVLKATGGDPGETLVVQTSTHLASSGNWISDSRQFTVGTNGTPILIQEPATANHMAFRLCTTNVVPQ